MVVEPYQSITVSFVGVVVPLAEHAHAHAHAHAAAEDDSGSNATGSGWTGKWLVSVAGGWWR